MSKNNTHESDVAFIRSLAELLRDNDLTELQVKREYGENDGLNVRVSRQAVTVAPEPEPFARAARPHRRPPPAAGSRCARVRKPSPPARRATRPTIPGR